MSIKLENRRRQDLLEFVLRELLNIRKRYIGVEECKIVFELFPENFLHYSVYGKIYGVMGRLGDSEKETRAPDYAKDLLIKMLVEANQDKTAETYCATKVWKYRLKEHVVVCTYSFLKNYSGKVREDITFLLQD